MPKDANYFDEDLNLYVYSEANFRKLEDVKKILKLEKKVIRLEKALVKSISLLKERKWLEHKNLYFQYLYSPWLPF